MTTIILLIVLLSISVILNVVSLIYNIGIARGVVSLMEQPLSNEEAVQEALRRLETRSALKDLG